MGVTADDVIVSAIIMATRSSPEPVAGGKRARIVHAMCALKACGREVDPSAEGVADIKSSLGKGGIPPGAAIEWKASGEASLHVDCWKLAIKSARARSKKNMSIAMSVSEKALVKEAAGTVEFHDSLAAVQAAADKMAALIQQASHCIAFTGAGISTAAGIGDYRGKNGKWTELDRGGSPVEEDHAVPYERLRPTYTHEALVKLVEMGLVKHVISQNGDGLHTLSGLQPGNLSELHGNVFVEVCTKCGQSFERPFYVMDDDASQYYEELQDNGATEITKPVHAACCEQCGLNHNTERKCTHCKGQLKDTIINFGDDLNAEVLSTAEDHAQKSDLCLSLGSTMLVTPACNLVEMGRKPLRLVIVNRQKTGFDTVCLKKQGGEELGVRVYGDCDQLMRELMQRRYCVVMNTRGTLCEEFFNGQTASVSEATRLKELEA